MACRSVYRDQLPPVPWRSSALSAEGFPLLLFITDHDSVVCVFIYIYNWIVTD